MRIMYGCIKLMSFIKLFIMRNKHHESITSLALTLTLKIRFALVLREKHIVLSSQTRQKTFYMTFGESFNHNTILVLETIISQHQKKVRNVITELCFLIFSNYMNYKNITRIILCMKNNKTR